MEDGSIRIGLRECLAPTEARAHISTDWLSTVLQSRFSIEQKDTDTPGQRQQHTDGGSAGLREQCFCKQTLET